MLFAVTSNGFYSPPPPLLRKSGLKLVCNVNIVRSCPETSKKMCVHEYGFWLGFALFLPQKDKAAGPLETIFVALVFQLSCNTFKRPFGHIKLA